VRCFNPHDWRRRRGTCLCGPSQTKMLFVWLWLVVNDRKFPVKTVFFFHTNQPAVLLHEPATIRTSQPIHSGQSIAYTRTLAKHPTEVAFPTSTGWAHRASLLPSPFLFPMPLTFILSNFKFTLSRMMRVLRISGEDLGPKRFLI